MINPLFVHPSIMHRFPKVLQIGIAISAIHLETPRKGRSRQHMLILCVTPANYPASNTPLPIMGVRKEPVAAITVGPEATHEGLPRRHTDRRRCAHLPGTMRLRYEAIKMRRDTFLPRHEAEARQVNIVRHYQQQIGPLDTLWVGIILRMQLRQWSTQSHSGHVLF